METVLLHELLKYVIESIEERNPMINIAFWKCPSKRKASEVARQLRYGEGSCYTDEVRYGGRL